jgi:type II secretory ATPase GspE/PulE/Tfp pilus assembly ATPase PilB-like protein
MGVEPFLISSSVIGVVAQRLVRTICPRCKLAYTPGVDELAPLGLADRAGSLELRRGEGCNNCDGTGYQGRIGVFETLVVNDEMRRLILTNPGADQVKQLAVAGGMVPMRQNAVAKLLAGVTTTAEISKRIYVGDDAD